MILFLTGNTFRDRTGCEDKSEMIPDNHLIDEMQKVFPDPCRALYFSDGPDDFEFNDLLPTIPKMALSIRDFSSRALSAWTIGTLLRQRS